MTASERELKEELAVGFQKKLSAAKDIFGKVHELSRPICSVGQSDTFERNAGKVLAMKPLMMAGNVEEIFRALLMDKELMTLLNLMRPGTESVNLRHSILQIG